MLEKFGKIFYQFGTGLGFFDRLLWIAQKPDEALQLSRLPGSFFTNTAAMKLVPDMERTCQALGMAMTLASLERFKDIMSKDEPAIEAVDKRLRDLMLRMGDEVKEELFLHVPKVMAQHYNQPLRDWEDAIARLPKAEMDVREAEQCFALSRPTASVFHLMRIMEIGVQEFGSKLGVSLPMEKNWQNILDEINKAIKALPQTTLVEKRTRDDYAGVAAHLFNVKTAWRNNVMHPKSSYSMDETADLINHVKSFMKYLEQVI